MTYLEGLTDPYQLDTTDLDVDTPNLAEVIARAIRELSMGLRVAIPASVHAVKGNQLVDLQPLFKTRYVNDRLVDLPIITNALVSMPMGNGSGGAWGMKYPIAAGDVGLCLFADRSLDIWSQTAATVTVDPQDSRAHDLTDAIFLPGLPSIPNQTTDSSSDLTVTNGLAQLRLEKSGRFQISNGTNEAVDLMCQLTQSLIDLCSILTSDTFTLTMMGPQPFIASTVARISQQAATTAAILSKFNTLRG